MTQTVTVTGVDDVRRAAGVIAGVLYRTPMFTASSLSPRIHLKAELFQRTGSFKVRGVLNKLASLTPEQRSLGVIGISAGNHAQALAWGAAREGLDALVVMYQGASEAKIAATRAYGAAVDVEAPDVTVAWERLERTIAETGRTFVHPFDDPLVLAGQGTVGLEIVEDVPGVDTIVVPAGGGGLVAGISAAAVGRQVVVVEPEGSRAVHDALRAGHSVPVTPISVADGLSAPFAGENAVATLQAHGARSVLVSEDEIAEAFRWLYGRAKLACEPAAAVGLAAVLSGKIDGGVTAVVVSGGNVSADTAAAILSGR